MIKAFRIGLVACLLGASSLASAVPILEVTANAPVAAGDTFTVEVSALVENEYVGAYDLNLAWDPVVLSLVDVAFDVYLDGPVDSIAGSDAGTGILNVFEVSLGALANQAGLSHPSAHAVPAAHPRSTNEPGCH